MVRGSLYLWAVEDDEDDLEGKSEVSRCNRGDGYIAKCPGQAEQREEQQGRLNRAPGGRRGKGKKEGEVG